MAGGDASEAEEDTGIMRITVPIASTVHTIGA